VRRDDGDHQGATVEGLAHLPRPALARRDAEDVEPHGDLEAPQAVGEAPGEVDVLARVGDEDLGAGGGPRTGGGELHEALAGLGEADEQLAGDRLEDAGVLGGDRVEVLVRHLQHRDGLGGDHVGHPGFLGEVLQAAQGGGGGQVRGELAARGMVDEHVQLAGEDHAEGVLVLALVAEDRSGGVGTDVAAPGEDVQARRRHLRKRAREGGEEVGRGRRGECRLGGRGLGGRSIPTCRLGGRGFGGRGRRRHSFPPLTCGIGRLT